MTNPKPTLKVVDEGESGHRGAEASVGDQPSLPIPEPGKSRSAKMDRSLAGFDIGVVLRQNRLKQRKDLDEIATALCIRRDYLEAIEDGRNHDLPGPTYALGFLRAYAEYLGLNGDDAVGRYKSECTDIDWETRTGPSGAKSERSLSPGAMLVGGVLAAVVAYGAWVFLFGSDGDGGDVEEAAKIADTAAPAQESEAAAASPPESAVATATSEEAPAAAAEQKPVEQSAAAAQAETEKKVAQPVAKPKAEAVQAPPPAAPKPKRIAGGGRGGPVVLTMTDDSWMQIRDSGGAVLLTRLMRKGQSYEVPKERKGLTLLIGNSGAVQISVGERQLPALGPDGKVGRDIPLDAEKLLGSLTN